MEEKSNVLNDLFVSREENISKSKVKDSLESYIDKVNVIGSYENEKFYKIGFADAMNLILECINIKWKTNLIIQI